VSCPGAGFVRELAGDDYPIQLGPATDHPQTTTAVSGAPVVLLHGWPGDHNDWMFAFA
jgi:pimeloyl-ACP methyl ester carboxylesterase